MRDVYPGIDLICYGKEGRLEYDLAVSPQADPSAIRFRVDGADSVSSHRRATCLSPRSLPYVGLEP
jgi:hypothetical protein